MPANIYKNLEGKRVPGVTTVIGGNLGWSKNGLMYWAWNEGIEGRDYNATRDRAADVGTLAHAMVEAYIKERLTNEEVDYKTLIDMRTITDEMLEQAFNAYYEFLDWANRYQFNPIYTEHKLISEELQVGAQIDIASVEGEIAITDIKTSNDIHADHIIQVAAYSKVWIENYPDQIPKSHSILQLGKDGGFTYKSLSKKQIENGGRAFILLRELHDLKKAI